MSIKGTKTEQNLLKAFAGESQARNRYTYFASQAKKDGFEQISAIFLETADNEKEHAQVFFDYLEGGPAEITATYPAGKTAPPPRTCSPPPRVRRKSGPCSTPTSAASPRRRASPTSPTSFREIAEVEEQHELRYRKLLGNVKNNRVFSRDTVVRWHCRNCGYIHEGTSAPEECPACKHAQAY